MSTPPHRAVRALRRPRGAALRELPHRALLAKLIADVVGVEYDQPRLPEGGMAGAQAGLQGHAVDSVRGRAAHERARLRARVLGATASATLSPACSGSRSAAAATCCADTFVYPIVGGLGWCVAERCLSRPVAFWAASGEGQPAEVGAGMGGGARARAEGGGGWGGGWAMLEQQAEQQVSWGRRGAAVCSRIGQRSVIRTPTHRQPHLRGSPTNAPHAPR